MNEDKKLLIVDIPLENLSEISNTIIDYFGIETIKILLSQRLKTVYEGYRNKYSSFTKFLEKSEFIKISFFETFLYDIGRGMPSVYLNISVATQKVIDKYWTKELEIEYKKHLTKYGFFSYEKFWVDFNGIIRTEQYCEFFNKIEKKVNGEYEVFVFLGSLRFKWGLKPKILVKKCKYCGEEFIPILDLLGPIEMIEEIHPPIKSINDIDFCRIHILPYYVDLRPKSKYDLRFSDKSKQIDISKTKMIEFLKKLIELVGFIPTYKFKREITYLKNFDKVTFDETIKTLNDMPDCQDYKRVFGSWFKTLIAADVIEKDTRKMPRGYMCLAEDGHECLSLGEKTIDDWLYRHHIEHEKEPKYPGEGYFRGDWKSGKYFIEYWGMKGQEDYDNKILLKREIAKEHNISLIEINPSDLNSLDKKLQVLLERE